jgi:hypothetical protein
MNVDSIYIISVREAEKRREKFRKLWNHPDIKLNFFITERQKDPKKGCFEAHMSVIRDAKMKNYNKILVFEDDAFPLEPLNRIISQTNNSLKWLDRNTPKWEFFMLGYFPLKTTKTDNPNVVNIKCAFLSHAYIVNMKNVTIKDWKGVQVDNVLFCNINTDLEMNTRIQDFSARKTNIFGAYPMLATQRADGQSFINQFHLAQEKIFDIISENRLVELSMVFNLYRLLINLVLLFVFTIILLSIIPFKSKVPVLFDVVLAIYIIYIIVFFICLFIS